MKNEAAVLERIMDGNPTYFNKLDYED